MKSLSRFLVFALALISVSAHAAPVATTAGSNLTAYNSGSGSLNNNNWNTMTNGRSGSESAPTADFGNCNALILRCAQPKCSSGGCTDMMVASSIVSGCVNSNATCKQYGDDLINSIAAQLVAQSTARANQAAAAAQQNNQQMMAMQQQMQALQQQIATSNQAMQDALAAQQQANAQAIADATAAAYQSAQPAPSSYSVSDSAGITELTTTQRIAAESGVNPELMMREQISGEILTQIENAEKSLKTLKETMNQAFEYAGCDSRGDNCTGPKRVKKFKDLAGQFFDPYEDVLDDLYEAIILSQSVGVDVSNIYMLLNNTCDRWAKYTCNSGKSVGGATEWPRYDSTNCSTKSGKSEAGATYKIGSAVAGSVRGGIECSIGQVIQPEDDTSCTMVQVLSGDATEDVKRSFLYPDEGEVDAHVRVGCASNALKSSWLFRGKKQQASIDIETLKRILNQKESQSGSVSRSKSDLKQQEQLKYCALTEDGYMKLQKYVGLRGLPTNGICINEHVLNANLDQVFIAQSDSIIEKLRQECTNKGGNPQFSEVLKKCFCYASSENGGTPATTACDEDNSEKAMHAAEKQRCGSLGGKWNDFNKCECNTDVNNIYDVDRCIDFFDYKAIGNSTTQSPAGAEGELNLRHGTVCGNKLLFFDSDCCKCIANGSKKKLGKLPEKCNNYSCPQ